LGRAAPAEENHPGPAAPRKEPREQLPSDEKVVRSGKKPTDAMHHSHGDSPGHRSTLAEPSSVDASFPGPPLCVHHLPNDVAGAYQLRIDIRVVVALDAESSGHTGNDSVCHELRARA
jgi:hypothetical protein